jgi:hypothetical protein
MTNYFSPENIITQVIRIVESDKKSEIRLNANGGNSILLVCPPEQEASYIEGLKVMLEGRDYSIIDLNELLVEFVKNNKSELPELFELLSGSIHQVFKAPDGEDSPDLFKYILLKIKTAYAANTIPVLIHSGALYGSGIDNIHLMENELVMKAKLPLIILYPASHEGDKLLFLNSRPASKYRCMIVN